MSKTFSYDEALAASVEYFNGNELSAKVFVDKYALRDRNQQLVELTPKDMHHRIAREFARIQKKKYKGKKIKPLTEDQIFDLLDQFKKIIPQGSPMYGIGNEFQYVSISNCFVVAAAKDSYAGICKTDEELVQIAKRRGGDGTCLNNLRPNGTATKNAARTSTGIIPFMGRFSNTIREVGQDGRRGALMLSVSVHHPEAIIPWDDKEDGNPFPVHVSRDNFSFDTTSRYFNPNKIDFITSKYDPMKVTGANISVQISDEFMEALFKKEDFEQRWPVDSKNPVISKKVSAVAAWDKLIKSAWQTAEPGVLFWDRILNESPAGCYHAFGFKEESTNPCGEIPLPAYDSCRLLIINLFGYVKNPYTPDAFFDWDEFYADALIAQRLMDDVVDLEEECIDRIIKKIEEDPEDADTKYRELALWRNIHNICKQGRRTGLGITALGDTIAALNIGYGTDAGIAATERIYKTLKFASYRSSVEMAKEIGTFPIWDWELEKNNPFINRIKDETIQLNKTTISGAELFKDISEHGRRNIANLTTAPAGSVSILTKLTTEFYSTSGIEPAFTYNGYTRKKKGNPSDQSFRSDEVDQNGDHWQKFIVYPSGVAEWVKINGPDVTKSPYFGNTAEELDWNQRVRLQAAAQKHVDHSISSTVNLPKDVTVERVKEIYETAYKAGCKGVTIYRDGCRSGVLVTEKSSSNGTSIVKTTAPLRPEVLKADVYHPTIKGHRYFVVVGLLGEDPYEVFTGSNHDHEGEIVIPKNVENGKVFKKNKSHYVLEHEGIEYALTKHHNDPNADALTRLISTSLRHGSSIEFIVEQLAKTEGDLFAFSKVVGRTLKKYIPDREIAGETMDGCETPKDCQIVFSEGCKLCKKCGKGKCG